MNSIINTLNNKSDDVNIVVVLISLSLCILTSLILKYVYEKKSSSLTGKHHVGSIIPLLTVTTFLVISVVKSSLALSLGLVGALSVIRFRTPIKEPEELVYLFLSIAIGLGFGANQILITGVSFVVIIFCIIFIFNSNNKSLKSINDYNLIFNWKNNKISSTQIIEDLKQILESIDVIKYEHELSGSFTLYLRVSISRIEEIKKIEDKFTGYSDLSFTFYESNILS